jgi:hypothetical protein
VFFSKEADKNRPKIAFVVSKATFIPTIKTPLKMFSPRYAQNG